MEPITLQPEIKTEWKYEYHYDWIFGQCPEIAITLVWGITITIVIKVIFGFLSGKRKKRIQKQERRTIGIKLNSILNKHSRSILDGRDSVIVDQQQALDDIEDLEHELLS